MASNSEANLPSDFDIDEVINCWGEHINSSKDIGFELEQLGIPNDVKTSQNTTPNHASLPAAVVSSQQTQIPGTQNTGQSLFVTPSSANSVRNPKSRGGFAGLGSLPTPSFPSESLNIPSINLAPSNRPLLRFPSGLVQNPNLANQLHRQQIQNVQNTTNLLNENVPNFPDADMDESDDLVEGPLDKIVDQIMDRELNQAIMKTSALSNTAVYGQHSVMTLTSTPRQETLSVASGLGPSNVVSSMATTQNNSTLNLLSKLSGHSKSPFSLQPPNPASLNIVRTSIMRGQSPVTSSLPLNNVQQKTVSVQQATADIEELLKIQQSVRSTEKKTEQSQFLNQLPVKSTGVLTSSSLASPVVMTKPANTKASYAFASNTNLPLTMPHVILEDMGTGLQNNKQPNKTIISINGGVPQKMSLVTSASNMPSMISNKSSQRNASTSMLNQGVSGAVAQPELRDMAVLVSPLQDKKVPHSSLAEPTMSKQNLTQGIASSNTTKPYSFFTSHTTPTISLGQPKTQKTVENRSSQMFLSNIPKQTAATSEPIGATVLKITSPSTNILTDLQQPVNRSVNNPSVSTQSQFLTQSSPVLTTAALNQAQCSMPATTNVLFPKIQLSQLTHQNVPVNVVNPSKSMVFTLAPGSQSAAALKALPLLSKEKLAGRQIFFLQQPGQMVTTMTPSTPNMKIVFVNEGSVPQLVSGQQKSSVQPSSPAAVCTQASKTVLPTPTSSNMPVTTHVVTTTQQSPIPVKDSPVGSPSSVNSSDSDTFPTPKQTDFLKRKAEDQIVARRKRGKYRKKDPNRPVKPLSSFQKFFQKTQVTVRQKFPSAAFADVSKIAKAMWENLGPKEKKVYQDEWRAERIEYKKAMAEYEASFNEYITDGPSTNNNDQPSSSPVPVSPTEPPRSVSPVSSTASTCSVSPPTTVLPAVSHGSGKPLAMMLANKTKMASAQSSTKVSSGMTKSSSNKTKGSSNGIDDSSVQVIKKKQKINPIPKKPCIRESCGKFTKTTKERGTLFCSDQCVMLHCRNSFKSWVDARRVTYKAVS